MLALDFDEPVKVKIAEPKPAEPEVQLIKPDEVRWLGVYDNLDFATYQRAPGINNSGLKTFHRSPAHYITEKYHPQPETRAKKVGHALHCLVCEPEKFRQLYIAAKYKSYRTDEAKAWLQAAEEAGFFVLRTSTESDPFWNPPEWDLVHRMADSLLNNPVAALLLQGYFERSIFWVDKGDNRHEGTYKLCKMRADIYNQDHRMLVDLKSAEDASYEGFRRAVHSWDYHRQEPYYLMGATSEEAVKAGMDVKNGFIFIVVEKQPPWAVAGYKLDPEWVRVGREIIHRDLQGYKQCHDANEWPCYGWQGGEVFTRDLVMPGYANFQRVF